MHVWSASYGSNLSSDRFQCYLRGGRPEGASRTYPGARNQSPPEDDRALSLSDDDLAAYLLARPGIQPGWDAAGLADLVSEPGRP